ncbi:hypothetical protein ACFL1W_00950 [Candidatus Margulisiibacteriota bacterium]
MKKAVCSLLSLLLVASAALAHQPVLVEQEVVEIEKPEISRAFYDELHGSTRSYVIVSDKEFDLYINLLVPKNTNPDGRYSARILQDNRPLTVVRGDSVEWLEFYEPFGGDTYLKGPEWKQRVPAGRYEIEVFSADNQGKYALAVGEKEFFGPKEIASVYTEVPKLKGEFFGGNPISFLWTPFGIAAVIVIGGLLYWILAR